MIKYTLDVANRITWGRSDLDIYTVFRGITSQTYARLQRIEA